MDGVRNFIGGLASVAETVMHEASLHSDSKNDIYHEWFSTLRMRHISQLKTIESKLHSKIVRQALEDTLQDMLQKNYERTDSRERERERVTRALVAVLNEYFTMQVIRLFVLSQMDENPNGFNINRSFFFNCLINATRISFNTIDESRGLVYEAVQRCKRVNRAY